MKNIYMYLFALCLGSLLFSGCVMPVGPKDDFSSMKDDVFSNLIKKNIQTTTGGDKFVPVYVGTDELVNESRKILLDKKKVDIVSVFHKNDGKCTPINSELLQCSIIRSWKKKAQSSFARVVDWSYDFGNYNDPILQVEYLIHLDGDKSKSIKCKFIDLTEKN